MEKIEEHMYLILVLLMMAVLYAIYKMYQTEVNSKNFIVCVYLYVLLSLFLITLIGKYTSTLSITESQNVGVIIVSYFIMAFGGLFLIFQDKMFMNHIGLLLLCLSIGLIIGVSFRYANNIRNALILSSIIIFIFTLIAFCSNEEQLLKFKDWLPYLTILLFIIIVAEVGYLFLYGYNENFKKIMNATIIILFLGFVLSDTSKIMLESKNLNCIVHNCINYPKNVVGLLLDYVNIFVRMTSNK
jgi:FtsH-binding integral membrane protein